MTAGSHGDDVPGHAGAEAHHLTDDHGDEHGHDDHAHADEPLGPIDTSAWGAGLLGVILGLVVVACFVVATRPG